MCPLPAICASCGVPAGVRASGGDVCKGTGWYSHAEPRKSKVLSQELPAALVSRGCEPSTVFRAAHLLKSDQASDLLLSCLHGPGGCPLPWRVWTQVGLSVAGSPRVPGPSEWPGAGRCFRTEAGKRAVPGPCLTLSLGASEAAQH